MVSTGVSGLDTILGGGFIRTGLYQIQGDPGSGKTTIALQFLLERIREHEKVLYVTLTESRYDLEMICQAHGWSTDTLEICDLTRSSEPPSDRAARSVFHPSETELAEVTKMILDEVSRVEPGYVVFDGLAELRLLSGDTLRYRHQLLSLKSYLVQRGITALLLDDRSSSEDVHTSESIVGGTITLDSYLPQYGRARRRLYVGKVRAGCFQEGYNDYEIRTGGVVVYPRLVSAMHYEPFALQYRTSGIPNLDQMLAGGLRAGTSAIFIGPSGVGKSTMSMQFVAQALKQGLKAVVYSFDEVLATFIERAEKISFGEGGALQPYLDTGRLTARQIDPAELSPGAFAQDVRDAIEKGASLVVIDSLNGYINAMPEERLLSTHLHELVSYLNQRGIVTIMIVAQHGVIGGSPADFNVSYLADAVLVFRYFESNGEVCEGLNVFKNRTGPHERTLRQFTISHEGIRVSDPVRGMRGLVIGGPLMDAVAHEASHGASSPIS
jgi:circadian clock protein KaiC